MLEPITPESMQAAREWFAQNSIDCIFECASGEVFCNDFEKLCEWQMESYADVLAGKQDHTFALLQMAYFIQTGVCVPLLPEW